MTEFKDIYAKEIHTRLLQEMRTGAYAKDAHLPRESELALSLGISRTQLRDILAVLECEGFITRRHGVGTIINRHVLAVPARMDMELEFLDMIYACGHRPGISQVEADRVCATAEEAEKLQLPEGTELVQMRKVYTADKHPAIYFVDVFQASLLKEECTQKDYQAAVFQILQDKCAVNCYMDVSRIKPVVADSFLADKLQVAEGTPLLYVQELDYDIEGKPVFYSRQYFVSDYFEHYILRKRL